MASVLVAALLGSLLAVVPATGPAGAADISICGRDPAVVDAIEVALDDNSFDCAAVDDDDLDDITDLGVRGYGRFVIDPDDFAGLDLVDTLVIEQSPRLGVVSASAFAEMPALARLTISGTGLRGFEPGAFAGLSSLGQLDLTFNQILGVPSGLFDSSTHSGNNLSSLQRLSLVGNRLSGIADGAFSGLSGLETLNLSYNEIRSIDSADAFKGLSALLELSINHNRIESLADGVASKMPKLETLYLEGNNLSDFPLEALRGHSRLRTLALEDNQISSLPLGIPAAGITRLKRLRLDDNEISSLTKAHFDGLGLWELTLGYNNLTSLPSDFFAPHPLIDVISLSGNEFGTLPSGIFDGLGGLFQLHLSDMGLTSLDAGVFADNTNLRQLTLIGNELTTLPATLFENKTELGFIYLQRNRLTGLDENLFDGLTNLEQVFLGFNQLTSVHENLFDENTYLSHVGLNDNSLTSLHQDLFADKAQLRNVDLSDNGLTTLPETIFRSAENMQTLDLSHNQIGSLPENLFDPMTSMTNLYLRDNRLTGLHENALDDLDSLFELDLSCNRFASFNVNRLDGPAGSLGYIDLSGNHWVSSSNRNTVKTAVAGKLTDEYAIEVGVSNGTCESMTGGQLKEVFSSAGTVEVIENTVAGEGFDFVIHVGADVDELTISATPLYENWPRSGSGWSVIGQSIAEEVLDAYSGYSYDSSGRPGVQVKLRDARYHRVPLTFEHADGDVYHGFDFGSTGSLVTILREQPPLREPCAPGAVSLETVFSEGLSNGAYGHGIPGLYGFDGSRREFLVPAWAAADKLHCVARTELWREDGRFEEDRIPGYPDPTDNKAIYDIVGTLDTSVPELAKAWDGAPYQQMSFGLVEGGWTDRKTRLYEVYRYTVGRFGSDGSFSGATTRWIPVLPFYVDRDASWHEPYDANGNFIPANDVEYYVKIEMGGANQEFGRGAAFALSGDEEDLAVGLFTHHMCVASTGRPVCGNPASPIKFSAGDVSCSDFSSAGSGLSQSINFNASAASNSSGHACFKLSRSQGVCSRTVWTDPATTLDHLFYDGCKMFDYAWARNASGARDFGSVSASTAAVPWPKNVATSMLLSSGEPRVLLQWDEVESDARLGIAVTDYQVLRRGPGESEFSVVGTTGGTTAFIDGDVEYGSDYSYVVKTVTADRGPSLPSDEASVSMPAAGPPKLPLPWAPALEPVGLAATSTDRGATLRWVVPAQPDEVYVSDMYLERLEDDGDGGVEVAQSWEIESDFDTSAASSWTHTVSGLESGTQYRFSVRLATEDQGDAFSETLEVSTQSEPPVAPRDLSVAWSDPDEGDRSVDLSWEIPTQPSWLGAVDYVQVQRDVSSGSSGGNWQKAGEVSWDRATTRYSFNDPGADADAPQQRYRIRMYAAGRVHFSDVAVAPGPDTRAAGPLRGFSLVNATDQSLVAALGDGDTVELANPATGSFAISADLIAGHNAGSVALELTGPVSYGPVTDNSAPYSLHGDTDDGDVRLSGQPLPAGEYTLTATAWSQTRLRGREMGTLEISFTVTEDPDAPEPPDTGSLAGFRLVNAADQSLIAALADGDTVALDSPATGSFAIEATIVDGHSVGSVSFELTGPVSYGPKTESYAPYSLHGDTYSGDAELHGQPLPPGDYTLTAIAWSQRSLKGGQVGTLEISFTITTID